MKSRRLIEGQNGFALPMAMVMLMVFLILGTLVIGYVSKETRTQKSTVYFLQARYLAEAGVDDAMFQMKKSLQAIPNTYDWANNPAGFPASYLPPGFSDWVPLNLSYDPATGSTASSDTYSYSFSGKPFGIRGKFKWEYVDTTLPQNTQFHWVKNTIPVTDSTSFPTGGMAPDSIYFNRTIIGTGQVALPDGTEVVRKIKVGIRVSFLPLQTPDSPVYISTTQWQDVN